MRKLLVIVGIVGMIGGLAGTASAATIGLVGDDACLSYNGVIFCDADIQPTGTGIFNPFLRTNPGGGIDPSSGWNTDAKKSDWADPNHADDPWTSALLASTLGTVASPLDGTGSYVVFTVDINQQGNRDEDNLLSLSHFQLFNCSTSTYTSVNSLECSEILNLFGGTVTYDANGRPIISDTTWVDFDYRNHTGSGSGDIHVYVPFSYFSGVTYVALLDGWGTAGAPGAYPDNDGFQEWRAQLGTQTCPDGSTPGGGQECDIIVPEPAALLLFGMGAFGGAYRLRRRRTAA